MTIKVENLAYSVNQKKVLYDVTFSLEEGHITLFVGKSGSGKTTILRALAGLVKPIQGDIVIQGETPALVFQQPELFSHMTVLGNCTHPQIHIKGRSSQEARDKAFELLNFLGIAEVAESYPDQLSGGQKQRVAIVRSLCMDKRTLLFDEPTSALDPFATTSFRHLLETLRDQKFTVGVTTHDMQFVHSCLDRIYLIDQGTIAGAYDKRNGELNLDHPLSKYLHSEEY
ncbi:Arginine transport ATP-binding protein ArtM,glutamine ABC transporter ATP-binding protein,ABC-type histidine transport system, ATPase component,ectoine/hydroxyectoine ABC transporter, ATP-binding protein EhuA,ABC transporter [Chlamydia serpentis]|uniref:ABC transporter domain-containing protein n=1 Tax=Chlamydia serpentis TaxID=1967782 RepID=A0A2R8FAA5_9CHLA|nr:ATP-binding cassette domain-containing protein [Chlamydia serpentis]SPN73348.1 Arginine transport ATP-binding protein ArtM,glutamine ABC transporter ATP-binding protein,ABC-type histidine transport system, ATPase component,ectoine/hydroxyectoine ABC transporter, ATP-binding protein EhuA,ABC transporter [Chlamydia serpentis]